MWYDERGGGEPLVLLHGGAVDSRFFAASIDLLADRFHVFAPDARGHGRTPDVEGPSPTRRWRGTRSRSWRRWRVGPRIWSATVRARAWRCTWACAAPTWSTSSS